jgi:5-methylcytosine-specific restriction endonuclease McrA
VIPTPSAGEQLQFLFQVQRLLSESVFVTTYKFALLLAIAECAVERADDTTQELVLDTDDLAEKFVALYWKQVLPWVAGGGLSGRLHQATGRDAAILAAVERAYELAGGSLPTLLGMRQWTAVRHDIGRTIALMPLWKLQTIGGVQENFLYSNTGGGRVIRVRRDAVYCLRQFYPLISDLVQAAWIRFIQRLPRNALLLGQSGELRDFLFGSDRAALARYGRILVDYQDGLCFYCQRPVGTESAIDHFIPWSRYPADLGHNFVLADARCNSNKADRLPAVSHLARWSARNDDSGLTRRFDEQGVAHDLGATEQIAIWAYGQAERARSHVWVAGRDGLELLDGSWRDA